MSSEQQEYYEWNEMRVARNKWGTWAFWATGSEVWVPLNASDIPSDIHRAVAAELDRLYPKPRTVTLDNNNQVWELIERTLTHSTWMRAKSVDKETIVEPRGSVFDTLDRYQNGDDR